MSDALIEEQILEGLRRHGSMTLCEMYFFLPYDAGGCELDGPLLELEKRQCVFSRGKRATMWGEGIVWHLCERARHGT